MADKLPHSQSVPPTGPNDVATKVAGGNAEGIQTTGANVTVSGSAPPTAGQALVATSPTLAEWQDVAAGSADALSTTGDAVTVSGSAPPTIGQGLVAISPTEAEWQDIAAGSADALSTTGTAVTVSGAAPPTTGQVLTATNSETATWQTPVVPEGGGGGTAASGIDTVRIGSNTSHGSETPLVVGQFEMFPADYHALSTFTLRAVAANGSSPLTSHVRLYNLTNQEQVAVLDFVDTLNPELQTLKLEVGTVSGTLRNVPTLYEAQVFVDSPAGESDTIELGSAEIRVQVPILSSGIDTIRFDMAKSYSSETPLSVGQFELNTDDYPSVSGFTLRAIAANGTSPLTSHVQLYNITDSEVVATLDFVNTLNVQLQQENLIKGTTSGTLRAESKIYEARIYVDSPSTENDTIEFGSAEIRVHYN